MKVRFNRLIAMIMCFVIFLCFFDFSDFVIASGSQSLNHYVGNGYTVDFQIISEWDGHCNAEIYITNTTNEIIHNWNLSFLYNDEITNVYNASVEWKEGTYYFKNLGYNQDILPGEFVSFGFMVSYDEFVYPKEYKMTLCDRIVPLTNIQFENVIMSSWENGYTGEIHIKNNSKKIITDWSLLIHMEDEFVNVWNAVEKNQGNNEVLFVCPDYNQNIEEGEMIVIGYQANGCAPDSIELISIFEINDFSDSSDSPSEESSQESTDKIDEDNEDNATDDNDKKVLQILSEELTYNMETNEYFLESEIIELNGMYNGNDNDVEISYLISDAFGNVILEGNVCISNEDEKFFWSIDSVGFVVGYNLITFFVNEHGKLIEEKYEVINSSEKNMNRTLVNNDDTDNDSVIDYYEMLFGTDNLLADTDRDGLSDNVELFFLSTNAKEYDSDFNGICDGEEDQDKDLLNTMEEIQLGTSDFKLDSDEDGLSDYFEYTELNTNPIIFDTDEDGFSDGEEYELFLNPLSSDSDGDGELDNQERIEQKYTIVSESESAISEVSVYMECYGSIQNSVYINDVIGVDLLSSDVAGLIGHPYNFECLQRFDEAIIEFHYNELMLGDVKEDDLCLLWFDEKNMDYVLLADSVCDTENNVVCYKTNHFSTYMLVDRSTWEATFADEIIYAKEGVGKPNENYDFVFVFDCTLSSREVIDEEYIIEDILENMQEGDRAVTLFCEPNQISTKCINNGKFVWKNNKEDAKASVSYRGILRRLQWATVGNEYAPGTYNGYISTGFTASLLPFEDKSTNKRMVFLIYDGKVYNRDNSIVQNEIISAINNSIEMNVTVHSISVGDDVDSLIENAVSQTGGKSYMGKSSNEVTDDVKDDLDKRMEYSEDYTDTDGDGLLDVWESNGMRVQNGSIVYTNPDSADTDGDGVDDGIEMGKRMTANQYFIMLSNPNDAKKYLKPFTEKYVISDNKDFIMYRDSQERLFTELILESSLDNIDDDIFGRENVYNSNNFALSESEKNLIISKTLIMANASILADAFPFAGEFLKNYIGNTEKIRNFDVKEVIYCDYKYANSSFKQDVYNIVFDSVSSIEAAFSKKNTSELSPEQRYILDKIEKNEKIYVSISPTAGIGARGSGMYKGSVLSALSYPDMFLAFNSADSYITAEISYENGEYNIHLYYTLWDYYDWDRTNDTLIGLVSPQNLFDLCRVGNGRFYQNIGSCDFEFVGTIDNADYATFASNVAYEFHQYACENAYGY